MSRDSASILGSRSRLGNRGCRPYHFSGRTVFFALLCLALVALLAPLGNSLFAAESKTAAPTNSVLSSSDTKVITNLDDALDLATASSRLDRPVKARATVTYCHPQWRMLFVQSGELGTFMSITPETAPLKPGDVVEIDGETSTEHGYPEIKVNTVKATGQWQTLVPKNWELEDILNGRASGQWIQVEGRVLAAYAMDGRLFIEMAVGSTNLTSYLLNWQPDQLAEFLDARVRITGVLSVQFDNHGHRAGVAVLAQEPSQVQIVQPAAINPLDIAVTTIDRIQVSKDGKPERIHIQGALEQSPDGVAVSVHDRTGTVQLRSSFRPPYRPGSGVDVFGYPSLNDGEMVLKDALILPTASILSAKRQASPQSSTNAPALPVLEAAQSIRRLSRAEAARGYPVALEGVVTFSDPSMESLFVQDASGGIYVTPAHRRLRIHPGQRVKVQGTTAAGDFAPIITDAKFEDLGEAPMPDPVRLGLDALLTGQFDCRWVEIHGVVQSATEEEHRRWLQVMTPQGQLPVQLGRSFDMAEAQKLVDARVCLRGVAAGQFNQQGQLIAVRLNVPNDSAISVDDAAPTNAFAIPTQRIADLYSYQPEQDIFRRIKISGHVTSVGQDQTVSLQDESGGILVRLMRFDRLPRVGDRVEILGFPVTGEFSITLNDAWSRIIGPGGDVPALGMTAQDILTNEPYAQLVQLDATLMQDTWLRPAQVLVLQSGSTVFEAVLPRDFKAGAEEQLEANTRLQVTGVCLLEGGRWGQVKSFRLKVRQAADLQVISRPSWWNLRRLLLTLTVSGVLGALGLIWNLLLATKNRQLSEQIRERERAEGELQKAHAALQAANDNLEQRVAERTTELREQIEAKDKAHAQLAAAQKELMEASREAGMAEIATGVLHNVGNVLNSVNVSNNIIQQKLRRSEFLTLGKVRGLLQEHEGDLPKFLTSDPKGQLVPGFIIKLADNIDKELSLLQAEHEQLTRNVEHIKEIVAVQQTYARVSGLHEKLSIAALADDALQINSVGFGRRGVEVVRDYEDVPLITVDKHKVLQILVNLITNAKHALDESRRPDPQLTIKIAKKGHNTVMVSVSDNGAGIAPENFHRVFSYGFTTRKSGHGFGLHSGAGAAKEMGGQLTAHSDGVGKGATFTLELPIEQPSLVNN